MSPKSDRLETQPFFFEGGPAGCLLVHGFTGSPPEMEYLGRALHAKGMTVSGVQLAGHGTTVEAMRGTGWRDWYSSAEAGLAALRARCEEVFVAGLSMGGALTLLLCARHGGEITAAAAMAPAAVIKDWRIHLAKPFSVVMPYITPPDQNDLTDQAAVDTMSSYKRVPARCLGELLQLTKEVQKSLPSITIPLLALQGMKDLTLWTGNAQYVYEHVSSKEKELLRFENSGHGVTVDVEKDAVAESVYAHFRKYSKRM